MIRRADLFPLAAPERGPLCCFVVRSRVVLITEPVQTLRPRRGDCVMAWSALQISNRLALPEQESRRRSPSVPRGAPQGRHLIKVEAGASSLQSNTIPKPSQMRQTISNRYMSADSCKAMTKLPSEQYHQMEYYGVKDFRCGPGACRNRWVPHH